MNLAACILLAVLPLIVLEKLKYISMPKEPLQDTSALNPVQQKNWKKYDGLYRTFMMQSGYLEREYDRIGKPKNYGEFIATMTKLGKSKAWDGIASMQPFKVKSGVKQIETVLNKMSLVVADLIDAEDQRQNTITFGKAKQVQRPEVDQDPVAQKDSIPTVNKFGFPFSTANERAYYELDAIAQSTIKSGAHTAEGKREFKLGIKLSNEAGLIKEEARKNGEEWAQ